jgi:hypothetical protein
MRFTVRIRLCKEQFMLEGLRSKLLGTPQEQGGNIWDWVLRHDDDAKLSMVVRDSECEIISEGTIRPGDVRETVANPDYQAMMRRGAERAREIRAAREAAIVPPMPEG